MRARISMKVVAAVMLVAPCFSASDGRTSGSTPAAPQDAAHKPRPTIADAYTPVTAAVLGAPTFAVLGTDGRYHVAYDLQLQNAGPVQATLQKVEVLDAGDPSRVVASFSGEALVGRLRALAARPVADSGIEKGGSRVLFIELLFASRAEAPKVVLHRLTLLGAANPGAPAPTQLEYTITPYDVSAGEPMALGPPVTGEGWVAMNGCCAPGFPHRSSFAPFNGKLVNAQRFAIDWMRLNDAGFLVTGDPSRNENWVGYGADVIAVADGTVVDTLDGLDANIPGALPDPTTITVETVDGNHVVMALGKGFYGFYAHLQKGSLTVKPGDKVKRGDKLGRLGNTGNSSAPHMHFHLMDGRSVLGSNGLPYVISNFEYAGALPLDLFMASEDLTDNFGGGRLSVPQPRSKEYPLAWEIVNFR